MKLYLYSPLKSTMYATAMHDVELQQVGEECETICKTYEISECMHQSSVRSAKCSVEAQGPHFWLFFLGGGLQHTSLQWYYVFHKHPTYQCPNNTHTTLSEVIIGWNRCLHYLHTERNPTPFNIKEINGDNTT